MASMHLCLCAGVRRQDKKNAKNAHLCSLQVLFFVLHHGCVATLFCFTVYMAEMTNQLDPDNGCYMDQLIKWGLCV